MKLKDFNNYKIVNLNGQTVKKKSPWPKILTGLLVTVLLILVLYYVKPNLKGFDVFKEKIKSFFDFSPIYGFGTKETIANTLNKTLILLWKTILLSFLGTVIGILVAIPLAFLSSKNIVKKRWIYGPMRIIMSIVRAFPPLILAFILVNAVSFTLAATITLAVFVTAIMTKWIYEELDSIDLNAFTSLQALGNQRTRSITKAVMPYLAKSIFSYGIYAFEMVIRFASILGVVGITSTIGYLMSVEYKPISKWGHMTVVLVVLICFIILIEILTIVIKKYVLDRKTKQLDIPKGNDKYRIAFVKTKSSKAWMIKAGIGLFFAVMIIYSMSQVEWKVANAAKLRVFHDGLKDLFHPDWTLLTHPGSENAIILALEAVLISVAAVMIGLFFSFIIGTLASRAFSGKYISWIFKIFLIAVRSIPAFVYAIMFIFLSPAPNLIFAGVLALGIHSIGMLGKLTYEKIDSVDLSSRNALEVMGANRFLSTRWALLKEVTPTLISNAIYRVEINFKSTIEIGAVGACSFGQAISFNHSPDKFSQLSSFIIVTIVVVLILEQISNILRRKIMTGQFVSKNNFVLSFFRRKITIKALVYAQAFDLTFKRNSESIKFNNYVGRKMIASVDNKATFNETKLQIKEELKNSSFNSLMQRYSK